MFCFECGKKIDSMDDCYFIAIDVPYINLPFHLNGCKNKVQRHGEEKYLEDNENKIIEWSKKH